MVLNLSASSSKSKPANMLVVLAMLLAMLLALLVFKHSSILIDGDGVALDSAA